MLKVISAHSLTFMSCLLWLLKDAAATLAIELRLRMCLDDQRRMRDVSRGQRFDHVDIAILGAQHANLAKLDGAHRARIDTGGVLALGQQVLAEVALAHHAGRRIELRSAVRA